MTEPSRSFLDIREAHYQRFFGPLTQKVMHSTDVKPVHVDIYQFEPTQDREFWTLITGGMSDIQQIAPDNCAEHQAPRAEILMYVHAPQGWMFNVLKGLAEMPFDNDTHLHWWHTIPNGMAMTAKPSLLTSYFFMPPYFEDEQFGSLQLEGDGVDFLWMVPITDAEREFAITHGSQALENRMRDVGISHILDESRKSIV